MDGDNRTPERAQSRVGGPARAGAATVHVSFTTPLTVIVQTPDGTAISDVEVEVWNLRKENTGAGSNKITFNILSREYDERVKPHDNKVFIAARKPHFGPPLQIAGQANATFDLPKQKPATCIMVLQASANLSVSVRYEPLDAPVANVSVTAKGPVTAVLTTDSTGIVKFLDLPAGHYDVTASYAATNALADLAKSKIGSKDWAVAAARQTGSLPEFPAGTNKCNLFVYEMVTGAGFSVPLKPHTKWGGLGATVMYPPNAGDWASPTGNVGTTSIVSSPEPGDIAAWSHNYADATGHVAIVSYPKQGTQNKDLAPGDDSAVNVTMRRQVTGANHAAVEEDDQKFWHYYDEKNIDEIGKILFRRLSK